MTFSDIGNELLEVEQQQPWDPTNYDIHRLPMTRVFNTIVLVQAVTLLLCNGLVVLLAFRARLQLLTSAANVFSVSLSISNVAYGAYLTGIRTYLGLFRYEWNEASCGWFAAINVYFIINCVVHLMVMCCERYWSLVLLKRIRAKHAFWVTLCLPFPSLLYTGLHFLGSARGIMSRTALYCYTTSFTGWIGALDITLLVCCMTAVLGGYALVFLQLHRVTKASASAIMFPNLVTRLSDSPRSEFPFKRFTASPSRSFMSRTISSSSSIPSAPAPTTSRATTAVHGDHDHCPSIASSSAGDQGLAAIVTAGPSIAHLAAQRASETRAAEKRLLKRALLTFLGYSFIYPWCYFIYLGHKYGRRPSVQEDYWICTIKLFAEICDPIILITLDRRFNAELRALFGGIFQSEPSP